MRQLRAFYFALYAANGILLPFFNLHLKNLQFTDWQIGIVASIQPVGRMIFPGMWGPVADRSRRRNALLVFSCACMTLSFTGVLGAGTFWGIFFALLATNFFQTLTGPLVDASALEMARRGGFDYGAVRAWGSAGFVVASLLIGKLLDFTPTVFGLGGAWLAYATMTIIASRLPLLPTPPPRPDGDTAYVKRQRRRDILKEPAIAVLLVCGFLNQLGHGVYYNFFTIHLRESGYTPFSISSLWALSVAAEVVLLYCSGGLIRRFGAANLIVISMLAGAVRWGAYGLSSAWWVLALMQPLHAFTFGAFQMAAMHMVHSRFPLELKVTGQSLFTIASWGAGYFAGSLFAGWANHALGAPLSFGISAGIALTGVLVGVPLIFAERRAKSNPPQGA